MAHHATESSPLLPSKLQDTDGAERRVIANPRTRRALCVGLPLAALALVALGWLFAGGSDEHASASDAELLSLLPPFAIRRHPIAPKLLDTASLGRAVPTNAFWTNLLVGDSHGLNDGGGEVTLSPYTVRSLPKRLDVSYGDTRRVVTNDSVTEYFNADVSVTGYSRRVRDPLNALLGDGNSTSRSIAAFDPLSVTLQYHFENETATKPQSMDPQHQFTALLVRGSPYLTIEYKQLIPVLELNATLVAVNHEPVAANQSQPPQNWTAKRFELDLEVYGATRGPAVAQKWVVYFATERTLQLQVAHENDYRPYNLRGELTTPTNVRLVDADFYTGAVRIAVVPSADAVAVLDASADVYPVSASVGASVENSSAYVSFNWTTKSLGAGTASPTAQLLMLASPHHAAAFSQVAVDAGEFKVLGMLGHRTVKSNMTAVLGSAWTIEEALPGIGFDAPEQVVSPAYVAAIKTSLANDSNYTPEAQDPYFFGKEVGRQARLALIADSIGDVAARDALVSDLERWLTPWLVGSNDNHFVYDTVWGGLCSKNGLKGVFWMTDFGNGWYNDHVSIRGQ